VQQESGLSGDFPASPPPTRQLEQCGSDRDGPRGRDFDQIEHPAGDALRLVDQMT